MPAARDGEAPQDMYPAPIEEYLRPGTIEEAVAALARFDAGEALFLAGGQSLMQAIKSRMVRPRCLIDLQAVPELKGLTPGNPWRIGAMTRYVEIAGCPTLPETLAALRDAASHVGDRQVRNRGTLGGSCCWNYVASCMPTVTLALGASFHLVGGAGRTRRVVADEFLLGPLETARADDEILTEVSFPVEPRTGSAYRKWGLVTDALPVVGVCMRISLGPDGRCSGARIALSGLEAGGQRVPAGEKAILGCDGSAAQLADVLETLVDAVTCQSDQWADSSYRQQLIRTLGLEVATAAFARARAGS